MDPNDLEQMLLKAPFHRWLGLKVLDVQDGRVKLEAQWNENWIANTERKHTHGGILCALIDIGANWAIATKVKHGVPTIDLRVDYHAPSYEENLFVEGTILRFGKRLSTAETKILSANQRLSASGRGLFLTE